MRVICQPHHDRDENTSYKVEGLKQMDCLACDPWMIVGVRPRDYVRNVFGDAICDGVIHRGELPGGECGDESWHGDDHFLNREVRDRMVVL